MGDLKVHVIYEYGTDMRPHSSAYIRLLQPLGHPTNHDSLQLTYDIDYFGTAVDVVIIDRLWRPDCSYELAENLLQRIRRAGAKIIYTVDDNFYGLKVGATTGFQKDYLSITGILLRQADAVIVSTYQLQHLFLDDNAHIAVVPNALDERLIVSRYPSSPGKFIPKPRVIIGYMGTFTHDDDFLMILPALELGRSGLLGLPYPEEYGGGGQPYEVYLQVLEVLAEPRGWRWPRRSRVHTLACFPLATSVRTSSATGGCPT